jgi:hypothetical protein
MLVLLRISNRRLCGLARLTEAQLATAAESIPNSWNNQLVFSHCIITDCPNVACCGHCRTERSSCTSTTNLAPRGWAHSYQCRVRVPEPTFSRFHLVRSVPAAPVSRTATLYTQPSPYPDLTSSSATQNIFTILWNTKDSLLCSHHPPPSRHWSLTKANWIQFMF